MISVIATKLGGPTDLGDLGMPVCFQIVFLIFLHMSVDVPHTLLCILWSEGGSKSTQRSGWIQVQWQTLCIIPEFLKLSQLIFGGCVSLFICQVFNFPVVFV